MKKRTTGIIAAVLSLLLLFASLPAVLASEAVQPASAVHDGHSATLEEILTGENCETDFCGRFFCEDCQESYFAPITCEDIGMPIVNLKGSLDGVSKTNKVTVNVDYSSGGGTYSLLWLR